MRILIDAHLSDEKTTGIGRYLAELLYALLSIDQRNEYIILTYSGISSTHPFRIFEAPNLLKIPVNLHGLDWRQHFLTPKIIKEVKPDVYHHPHFDLPSFHNVPSVVTIHDLKYIRHPEFFKERSVLKQFYMKRMMRRSLKRTKKVIAVSKSTRDDIISVFDTPIDKVSVVYHGVNSNHQRTNTKADGSKLLEKYKVKGRFILFVGEKRPHKNLVHLIEAFDIFNKRTKGAYQLVAVGKSYANYSEPLDKVKDLSLAKSVIFTEYISNDELRLFYQTADVLVLPSLYEGFGLPVLEAMNYGTPVIASNLTSLPEIVGEAGILVHPFNIQEIAAALEKVITNDNISEELKRKGIERAKSFTWEKTARQTLEIYREVYEKSR